MGLPQAVHTKEVSTHDRRVTVEKLASAHMKAWVILGIGNNHGSGDRKPLGFDVVNIELKKKLTGYHMVARRHVRRKALTVQ